VRGQQLNYSSNNSNKITAVPEIKAVDYAKKKGKGFVIGLSTMFMMDFFILW
jgi:hypothetical protein